MKKTIILNLIFLFSFYAFYGQTKAIVNYEYIIQNYEDCKAPITLYIDGDKTYCEKHFELHCEKGGGNPFNGGDMTNAGLLIEIFTDAKKIYCFSESSRQAGGTPLYAEGELNMKWEITTEKKVIDGYNVQKAIGTENGLNKKNSISEATKKALMKVQGLPSGGNIQMRMVGSQKSTINVWFATDIPLPYGPNGYYGLPGLIVLIEFETYNNSVIKLKNIKYDKKFTLKKMPNKKNYMTVDKGLMFAPIYIDPAKEKKWQKEHKTVYKEFRKEVKKKVKYYTND